MSAYIDHAAYYTGGLNWYVDFFSEVFGMEIEKQRTEANGLRQVWLRGGVQLCETAGPQLADGRAAHLCLVVDDLEEARAKALELGCAPTEKHHWIKLPDGLQIEMFQAAPAAPGV